MSIRTKPLVLTSLEFVRIAITKPFFVLGVVVKTFEMVVRVLAVVLEGTMDSLRYIFTKIAHVLMFYKAPSSVQFRVEVKTVLHIAACAFVALENLEV